MIKKYGILCLIIVLLFSFSSAAYANESVETDFTREHPQLIAEFRDMVQETMAAGDIPGLSVALVDEKNVLWSEGFGYRDRTGKTPVDTDTVFSIQSMSKTFTATAVMLAVEEGLLDLDTPITEYLPDFTVHSVYESHPERKITLRHLLSHTAGFTHEAPVGSNYDADARSFEAHIQSISDTWLRFPVGEAYAYSNLGIDLAGYILEKVSEQDFASYVDAHLMRPAGMTDSTFDMGRIRQHPNRAVGHDSFFWKMYLEVPMIPAGGVYASASDMAVFIQYHLRNQDAFHEMYTIPFPLKGQTEGYALGCEKNNSNNSYFINHNGGGFGFTSTMIWYPVYNIGVVVLTNSADAPAGDIFPYTLGHHILDKVLREQSTVYYERRAAYGAPSIPSTVTDVHIQDTLTMAVAAGLDAIPEKPQPDSARWAKFTGVYTESMRGIPFIAALYTVIEEDGALYFNDSKLTETDPGLFFTGEGEALDLRGSTRTYRNIRLRKLPVGLTVYGIILGAFVLIFLFTLLLWPVLGLVRRRKGGKRAAIGGTAAKIGQGILSGFSLLYIGTVALAAEAFARVMAASTSPEYMGRIRWIIGWIKTLSPLVILFSVAAIAGCVMVWKYKYWTRGERLWYTSGMVFSLLFFLLLQSFNLVLI